ncbi:hypothetical protein CLOSCI_03335 [[Clostridium] scindens ATCC 35704]|nr:hypothetical protein CLOSCI_03335 [[Clostridium] scindens ATCC 35704]
MTNRGFYAEQTINVCASFLLNIKGKKTSVVKDSILEQGQLTVNK